MPEITQQVRGRTEFPTWPVCKALRPSWIGAGCLTHAESCLISCFLGETCSEHTQQTLPDQPHHMGGDRSATESDHKWPFSSPPSPNVPNWWHLPPGFLTQASQCRYRSLFPHPLPSYLLFLSPVFWLLSSCSLISFHSLDPEYNRLFLLVGKQNHSKTQGQPRAGLNSGSLSPCSPLVGTGTAEGAQSTYLYTAPSLSFLCIVARSPVGLAPNLLPLSFPEVQESPTLPYLAS